MPSRAVTRERQIIRDTALPPHWFYHYCRECSCFRLEWMENWELHRNHCTKWNKKVNPDKRACPYFGFPLADKEESRDCTSWLRTCAQSETVQPRQFIWKMGHCPECRRDFWYRAYHPNYVQKYCCKRHRWEFRRFKKKSEKNAQVFRNYS
jgi:hypothetical protein